MNTAQVPRRFVRDHWGGTETVVIETSRRLQARGQGVSIHTTNMLAGTNEEVMAGVPVRRYGYFYPYLGLSRQACQALDLVGGNAFSVGLVRGLWRQPGLDLIHLHTGKRVGGIGRFVARRRGIPYVVSLHGGLLDVPSAAAARWTAPTTGALEWGRLLGWLVGSRRVLQDAATIVCVSQAEQQRTRAAYPHQRVVVLPNGVDTARFATGDGGAFRARAGIPPGARLVLCVGRIDPQKNQLALVDALPTVLERVPSAHLALVGHVTNDDYNRLVMDRVAQLGLANHVTLILGLDAASQELVDAYHAADVFALPSMHEPFGIVVLEAWAAGRAVVAARVGGIPDFVLDGVNGRLFGADDAVSLVQSLTDVLLDPASAAALAAAGRHAAVTGYDWETITDRLLSLYEEVCRERPVHP